MFKCFLKSFIKISNTKLSEPIEMEIINYFKITKNLKIFKYLNKLDIKKYYRTRNAFK